MKKLFFAIVLVLCSYSAFSQPQVILQRGNTLIKFSDFTQAVIDSAQNDDVIYLASGMYTGNVIINKKIVLIGVGHYPNSSPSTPGYTSISGALTFKNGSSGSIMTGIRANGQIRFGNAPSDTISGILIERCYISTIYMSYCDPVSSSHILVNNVIDNLSGYYAAGWILSVKSSSINNNIIRQVSNFAPTNTFSNNIFTGFMFSGSCILNNVGLCLFQNNVFYSTYYSGNPNLISGSNNIFTNNMFIGFTPPASENVFGNNYNYVDKDSVFENYTYLLFQGIPYFVFDYAHNYHLKTECVGKNAGNDGTDIGIYGGVSIWKDGGLPRNPHVSAFNITPAVPASGIINVNATVEGQNR